MVKNSIIAVIVAVVVVAGGIGYLAARDPGLFSAKSSSSALPDTSPGTRIVSPSEINQSMSGHWIEVLNVTVGVSNLSSLSSVMETITGDSQMQQNVSDLHINYAQAAAFVSSNGSSMAVAYASFSSVQFANLTNSSLLANISRDDVSNLSFGVTDGSFYAFAYAKTSSNYTAVFYDLYSNYFIIGVYHGTKNRTLSDFTNLASFEISILNSFKLNFAATEHLVSTATVESDFSTSYRSMFNMSMYFISPRNAFSTLENYSSMFQGGNSQGENTYSGILNATDNGTSLAGFGLESFHSDLNNSTLALGYMKGTNSSFPSQIYANITKSLNQSLMLAGSDSTIVNYTYDGMTFFVLNISLEKGTNITFSIGVKGDYLVASAVIAHSSMNSAVRNLMQGESSIL